MTVGICGNVICDGSLGSNPGAGEFAGVVVGTVLVVVDVSGDLVVVVSGDVVVVVVAVVAVVGVVVVVVVVVGDVAVVDVVVVTEAGLGRPWESSTMP